MSYQSGYYPTQSPRRRSSRLLRRMAILVWLLVFGCIGLRAFAIPFVIDRFFERAAEAVNVNNPLPSSPSDAVGAVVDQVSGLGLPPLPVGTFQITDQQATGYMVSQAGRLGLDRVEVQFQNGQVVATLGRSVPLAGEVGGTLRANVRAENGRVVLDNEQLDGDLSGWVSPTTIVNGLEDRLNADIAQQNRSVQSIDIQQGVAVITIQ